MKPTSSEFQTVWIQITEMLGQAQGFKLFSCSTQLSIRFILLINVKMPTNVIGILTFISMNGTTFDGLIKQETLLFVGILVL